MDQFTRRIIGFGVHSSIVDGVALCAGCFIERFAGPARQNTSARITIRCIGSTNGKPISGCSRTHLGLAKQCPFPRDVSSAGRIIEIPQIGGLHHRYERIAA
jgi:hypothetical protein